MVMTERQMKTNKNNSGFSSAQWALGALFFYITGAAFLVALTADSNATSVIHQIYAGVYYVISTLSFGFGVLSIIGIRINNTIRLLAIHHHPGGKK